MTRIFRRNNQCILLTKPAINPSAFSYAAIMLYGVPFQETSLPLQGCTLAHPHLPNITAGDSVYPLPLSLAATNGITIVFFSTGY